MNTAKYTYISNERMGYMYVHTYLLRYIFT
jgi:hypothetical protein